MADRAREEANRQAARSASAARSNGDGAAAARAALGAAVQEFLVEMRRLGNPGLVHPPGQSGYARRGPLCWIVNYHHGHEQNLGHVYLDTDGRFWALDVNEPKITVTGRRKWHTTQFEFHSADGADAIIKGLVTYLSKFI